MFCMTEVSIFSGFCTYTGLKHFDDTSREIQLEGSAWRGKNSHKTSEFNGSNDGKYHAALKQAEQLQKPEFKICLIGPEEDKAHVIFRKCFTPSLPSLPL